MKNIFLYTLLFTLCPLLLVAQAPDTLWSKTYGGREDDEASSIQQTSDSGYVIVGRTRSFGSGDWDVWLLRTDNNGDTLWTKTYGGIGYDFGSSVRQIYDGGYIITGTLDFDLCLIRTDSLGDTLWTKTYGWAGYEAGYGVLVTPDSGYVVVGESGTFSQILALRTDKHGDTLWTRFYGDPFMGGTAHSIIETSDGCYLLCGELGTSSGGVDVGLLKIDTDGDSIWAKTHGGTEIDLSYSIQETSDSGFIAIGTTESFGIGYRNVYMVKTDIDGDTLWTKTHGIRFSQGHTIHLTPDGGYIFVGVLSSYGQNEMDVYLVKTNADGDMLWMRTYGGTDFDCGNSIQPTLDGGYIIAGYTMSFGSGGQDVWLLKITAEPGIEEKEIVTLETSGLGPTILNGPLVLPEDKNCRVFDITGRVVVPDKIKPGIYFVEIDGVIAKKVVKVR